MSDRPAPDLADTLESIVQAFLDRPSAIRRDDDAWRILLQDRSREAHRMLGLDITADGDGRSVRIGVPGGGGVHVRSGRRGPAATRAAAYQPVVSHLADVLRGRLPHGDAGVRPLPDVCRAVLDHDGLDPAAAAAIASVSRRLVVRIGPRKHVMGLEPCRRKGSTPTLEWINLRFDLSRDPRIHVTGGKIVMHQHLPFLVTAALPGQPARAVIDHPALEGFDIADAAATHFGVVATIHGDLVSERDVLEKTR